MDEQKKIVELELTPSSFEKNVEPVEKEKEGNAEERPRGSIFGNVIHRSFELLILSWRKDLERAFTREDIDGFV